MPAIKSAKKKLRVDKKRESANKKMEHLVNIFIKKAQRKPTPKSIQEAFSIIDKGAKKNIIHKNKAARIKSRLSKLISKKIQSSAKPKTPKSTKAKSDLAKVASDATKAKKTKKS